MEKIWQVGVVVRNLDRAVNALMELIGSKDKPLYNQVGRILSTDDCGTVYKGDAQSMASCITCCISFENIELEFIQPYGEAPSEWKDFLENHGEGIHHLGFKIEDVESAQRKFQSEGYEEVQSGRWGEGEYHYFDTKSAVGFAIELMHFYQ